MMNRRTLLTLASVLVFSVGGLWAARSNAQDQPITRTELIRSDLAGIEGKETVIYIADVKPGAAGGKHTHYGDEFVYVLDGELIVEPVGKEPITLKQGETTHLSPDVVHAAKNGSASVPAKVLVFLVVEKGKPLAEAVK
jgi:quercetin dioxygenase-like cupin family protein